MKAISLWQPWASAIGPHPEQKHLETRSWQTPYRGWLAIHAAKRWTKEQQWVLQHGEAGSSLLCALALNGYTGLGLTEVVTLDGPDVRRRLPFGAVVAVGRLTGCLPTATNRPPRPECYLGDYAPGRYAWVLTGLQVLPDPVPARGAQGLFDLPHDVVRRIAEQLPEVQP